MKTKLTLVPLLLLLAAIPFGGAAGKSGGTPAGGGARSDFALFDGTDPTANEIGAQCAAHLGASQNAVAFTYYVTVSNWSTSVQVLRVLYADGQEMARYQIPPQTSFSFSQAAGGTAGVDDWIRIFAETPAPSGLAGSVSAMFPAAAQPFVGTNLCSTMNGPAP